MKFEINDKTGMLEDELTLDFIPTETTSGDNPISHHPITINQLETILQAVKKTQTKLVNKQIQEMQDSKNITMESDNVSTSSAISLNNEYLTFVGDIEHLTYRGTETSKTFTINDKIYNLEETDQNQKIVDYMITRYKLLTDRMYTDKDATIAFELKYIVWNAISKDIKDI